MSRCLANYRQAVQGFNHNGNQKRSKMKSTANENEETMCKHGERKGERERAQHLETESKLRL
jgi:hypothetical protein